MRHLLITRKSDGAILLTVPEHQNYRLPAGYTRADVGIRVWDSESPPPAAVLTTGKQTVTEACRKCGAAAYWQGSCCAERTAGFKGKWACQACKFIGWVRV